MSDVRLDWDRLIPLIETHRLEDRSIQDWVESFQSELTPHGYLPVGWATHDPRTQDAIIFNPARAARPLDHRAEPSRVAENCIVCSGRLTRVLDVAPLSTGYTIINKNLYPIVFPSRPRAGAEVAPASVESVGLHLLQWTSTVHATDAHCMPSEDLVVVIDRLAALEKKLLTESKGVFGFTEEWDGPKEHSGFVQIIKNSGAPVGGSVAHGHQQIAWTNVMPRKTRDDWRFLLEEGRTFSAFMQEKTPREFVLQEDSHGALAVPYFMRRPYDMMFWVRDVSKRYLFELDPAERASLARGWCTGIRLMRGALERIGRHVAYNMVWHTGPGAGIYVEFLPYSQEVGGFEQSGLWSCQSSPRQAAGDLRSILEQENMV